MTLSSCLLPFFIGFYLFTCFYQWCCKIEPVLLPLYCLFNRNMSKSKGWTLQSSLLMLWMDENLNQQSNKIADNEQLTITHLCNNQTVPDCSYTGNRNKGTQQVKYVGNTDVLCFGFNFMSPKWTKLN